jgi:hypothetical protein
MSFPLGTKVLISLLPSSSKNQDLPKIRTAGRPEAKQKSVRAKSAQNANAHAKRAGA